MYFPVRLYKLAISDVIAIQSRESRASTTKFCYLPFASSIRAFWLFKTPRKCTGVEVIVHHQEPDCSGRRDLCFPLMKNVSSAGATTIFNHSCSSSPSTFSFSTVVYICQKFGFRSLVISQSISLAIPSRWAPRPSKIVGFARTTESATSSADCSKAVTSL